MSKIQQQVRRFYDSVGWQLSDEGYYQNARYEDLRPVSAQYIHLCHLRVLRHLQPAGFYLLDAGSGPIQYPEYLLYSQGYQYRVCVDLSIVALKEARKKIKEHGLFVVADVSAMPFASSVFGGVISLHTFHHLPLDEHKRAYREIYRVMKPSCSAVVVNGWENPPLTQILEAPLNVRRAMRQIIRKVKAFFGKSNKEEEKATFVHKNTAAYLKSSVSDEMKINIFCWRSVSVRFLRAFIHPFLGGSFLLKVLYALEEKFPRFFGEFGQYPMIVIDKK